MAVKGKRRYDSELRRRQAGETRLRILDAAERLFAERGYTATTMDAIATEAGVAPDTVYASFGSKLGVLHRLLDVRVSGDERPIALVDRPGPQAVLAETDARRLIEGFAAGVTEILERTAVVARILRSAAAVEPEARALLGEMETLRLANLTMVAAALADRRALRDGLDPGRAATTVWTLASPEVHRLLRNDRGWSAAEFQAWLADSLTRTLVD